MGFSRQEYWSGSSCPPPGDLPDPGIEPASLVSPVVQAESFSHLGSLLIGCILIYVGLFLNSVFLYLHQVVRDGSVVGRKWVLKGLGSHS